MFWKFRSDVFICIMIVYRTQSGSAQDQLYLFRA